MTREEAIHKLKYLFFNAKAIPNTDEATDEALSMAVEALEQKPCDDYISRQAVLNILDDMVKDYIKENDFDKAQGVAWVKVQKLPPVTPQPKMGRWIEHFDESGKWYECDQCHTDWGGPVNYCPNCGKKM